MLKRSVVIVLATLSAACSTLPRAELQAYRDAFQAAQTAAEPIIADYAIGERAERLAELKEARGYTTENPYFRTFVPGTETVRGDENALATIGLPPGAEAVDRAFRAIAAYNETLVALAENRNVDEARGQLRNIVTDVSAVLPVSPSAQAVASAFSGVVTSVLQPLIAADNRAQARRIALDGHEPMKALIDLLIAHSEDQYATTVGPFVEKLENRQGDRDELISRINGWHQVYSDYVVLLRGMRHRLDELKLAMENPRAAPALARASAGAAELRAYAEGLRRSIGVLRAAR